MNKAWLAVVRKYKGTLLGLLMLSGSMLLVPVAPWMPEKSELISINGKADYRYPGNASGGFTSFSIGGETLHCSFSLLGGAHGCTQFEELVSEGEDARATYFWMETGFGWASKMLNTLEQNNKMVITSDQTYNYRLYCYEGAKKSKRMMIFVSSVLVILLLLLDVRMQFLESKGNG